MITRKENAPQPTKAMQGMNNNTQSDYRAERQGVSMTKEREAIVMKKIILKTLHMENFKGCKERTIKFGEKTKIFGMNGTGKSTIADAFSWLLFGKNSKGAEKFGVRPLDGHGLPVHNVEIKVVATLDVDDREVVLSKVQKEKWVKRRGADVKELQGNENLFEINGYPKSEKEYKAYISGLVDEDLFKLITNPTAFNSLPWKEQRKILMNLVNDVGDVDYAREIGSFGILIPELEQASTEDIKNKYTKAMSTWKKKQIELPARIDEISKQIVDIDVAEMELQRNALKEQISDMEKLLDDEGAAYADYKKKYDEVFKLRAEVAEYQRKANEKNTEKHKKIQRQIDNCDSSIRAAEGQIELTQLDIERLERLITRKEEEKRELQERWRKKKAESYPDFVELPAFDGNSLICPTCGQLLPEEVKNQKISDYSADCERHKKSYEEERAKFERKKAAELEKIVSDGNAVLESIKNSKTEIENRNNIISGHKENIANARVDKADFEKMLLDIRAEEELCGDQVFEEMQLRLTTMENSLKSESKGADRRDELKEKLSKLRDELSDVDRKISSSDNTAVEERIEELKAEQKEVTQKVADQEKMIYLLEEFIRAKMSKISSNINEKFKTVNFKLFNMQLNGGMSETCECTVNGVPFSDLNNGHRIAAGLDIISTLCELYGVSAPIFTDNAEAINDNNIPDMDCQMILLSVSEDKELITEVV